MWIVIDHKVRFCQDSLRNPEVGDSFANAVDFLVQIVFSRNLASSLQFPDMLEENSCLVELVQNLIQVIHPDFAAQIVWSDTMVVFCEYLVVLVVKHTFSVSMPHIPVRIFMLFC